VSTVCFFDKTSTVWLFKFKLANLKLAFENLENKCHFMCIVMSWVKLYGQIVGYFLFLVRKRHDLIWVFDKGSNLIVYQIWANKKRRYDLICDIDVWSVWCRKECKLMRFIIFWIISEMKAGRSMMSMEEGSKRRHFFSSRDELYDEEYCQEQSPEKKCRLTSKQVGCLLAWMNEFGYVFRYADVLTMTVTILNFFNLYHQQLVSLLIWYVLSF